MSIKEAADFLGIHPVTMQALAASGTVPTLEALIDSKGCDKAANEYRLLRAMNHLLASYFLAGKAHTDSTVAGILRLVGQIESGPPPQLPWD